MNLCLKYSENKCKYTNDGCWYNHTRPSTQCCFDPHNSSPAVGFSGSSIKPGPTITATNSGHVVENDFNDKRPEYDDEAASSQQSIPVLITKRPNIKKLKKIFFPACICCNICTDQKSDTNDKSLKTKNKYRTHCDTQTMRCTVQ